MTETCPNCAAALVFNPSNGMLCCKICCSSFRPETVKGAEKQFEEQYKILGLENADDWVAETDEEIQGEDSFYESSIYVCSQCGAEIAVNTTEASTACVYCGCPSIVFSRVSRLRKPTYIIPFKVTKEQAEAKVRNFLSKGYFIPKEIKNFSADCVRGIYIPYWITDLSMDMKLEVVGATGGKYSHTEYYLKGGICNFYNLTNDASVTLADLSSAKLEPYDINDLIAFDKNYLAGFYSDVADVKKIDGERLAVDKAQSIMKEELFKAINAKKKRIISQDTVNTIKKVESAMLPAWFVTFSYKGTPHTILVNGQTGKVSGGVPWNKSLFARVFAAFCLTFCSVFMGIVAALAYLSGGSSDAVSAWPTPYAILFGILLLVLGIRKIRKVTKAIKLTQSHSMFGYVKKRQGDL